MARTKQLARYSTKMSYQHHVCGLYYLVGYTREYLPQLTLSAHAKIVSSTSRTTLTQTFVNPKSEQIPQLRYTFPLYDGVSVVGFVCTINDDRVIRGVVQERHEAKHTFQAAVNRGETAALLEQLPEASDVFTTTVGNVPANATLKVEITYLGELKHDAEVDGIRFTIPTSIAPRYGSYPGQLLQTSALNTGAGINIVVDVEMPDGSNIKNVQSTSHPIAVTLGTTSTGEASGAEMSLQKASATLSLSTAELGSDFVLLVVTTNTGSPIAVLETHPTIPNHRALMATLVPKFSLPTTRPEIVFICDRSGSMSDSNKIPNLQTALQLFLKSLPLGVKFNICSFGSRHEFLFTDGSQTYNEATLEKAIHYVATFGANFGGTEIFAPMHETFKRRYSDMDLEVFLLTDGETWNQAALFNLVNESVAESKGGIRVFSLGIGARASHALIEGLAAAGNGFSQSVGENENMNSKVVRMLKAALTPHVTDYTLEVKYGKQPALDATPTSDHSDDEFELVERVMDALAIDVEAPVQQREPEKEEPQKPISLYDTDTNMDGLIESGPNMAHLPVVPEPKLLQAPFAIPPLHAFSRTSVYLLLSPETVRQQPKSVVLRGTSAHGPLELEIPVTVLAEKGETIHQLAARKAVKELEEGRGWIYNARYANEVPSPLLKDKYPGRFGDMVEREGVRLGVTYQIASKWCSFVAVEANEESQTDTATNVVQTTLESVPTRNRGVAPRKQLASKAARKSGIENTAMDHKSLPQDPHYGRGATPQKSPAIQDYEQQLEILKQQNLKRRQRMQQQMQQQQQLVQQHQQQMMQHMQQHRDDRAFGLAGAQQAQQQALLVHAQAQAQSPQQMSQRMQAQQLMNPQFAFMSAAPTAHSASHGGVMNQGYTAPPPPPPAPGSATFKRAAHPSPDDEGYALASVKRRSAGPGMSSSSDLDAGESAGSGLPFVQAGAAPTAFPPPSRLVHSGYMRHRRIIGLHDSSSNAEEDDSDDGDAAPNPPVPAAVRSLDGSGDDNASSGNPASSGDTLARLVALQTFSGAWRWDDALLALLGVRDVEFAAARAAAAQLPGGASDVLATALVVVFLEGRLKEREEEWEMLADKARGWLREELGKGGVLTLEAYCEEAGRFLRREDGSLLE